MYVYEDTANNLGNNQPWSSWDPREGFNSLFSLNKLLTEQLNKLNKITEQ